MIGFATADSTQIAEAVPSALQRDSLFRVVYRPPLDSAPFVRGRILEVAPLTITAAARQGGGDLILEVTAVHAVSKTRVLQTIVATPSRSEHRRAFIDSTIGSFAQQLALLTR